MSNKTHRKNRSNNKKPSVSPVQQPSAEERKKQNMYATIGVLVFFLILLGASVYNGKYELIPAIAYFMLFFALIIPTESEKTRHIFMTLLSILGIIAAAATYFLGDIVIAFVVILIAGTLGFNEIKYRLRK